MEITAHSSEDTKKLAQQVATHLQPQAVVALYGDLGSGKTTFTGYLVSALGLTARVQSPTFVIMRRYLTQNTSAQIQVVNHVDLYRLTTEEEVSELGLRELINERNAITVIEWPETAKKFLSAKTVRIYFSVVDENTRKINVQNLN
jgi:tRNA threonylcarbamoyladenosine biosynthesis protein TsaE